MQINISKPSIYLLRSYFFHSKFAIEISQRFDITRLASHRFCTLAKALGGFAWLCARGATRLAASFAWRLACAFRRSVVTAGTRPEHALRFGGPQSGLLVGGGVGRTFSQHPFSQGGFIGRAIGCGARPRASTAFQLGANGAAAFAFQKHGVDWPGRVLLHPKSCQRICTHMGRGLYCAP